MHGLTVAVDPTVSKALVQGTASTSGGALDQVAELESQGIANLAHLLG